MVLVSVKQRLKTNSKIVDIFVSDKYVEGFIKYEYRLKKTQSQLTNVNIYDLETICTDKCVPYKDGLYILRKISGKFYCDKTDRDIEKCEIDFGVFKGTNYTNEMLHRNIEVKGEAKKVNKKIVENILHLLPWIWICYVSSFKYCSSTAN